jgi:hypothetical protein
MFSEAEQKRRLKSHNVAWSYIGRFITGFGLVEYQVNQLFEALINVDNAAGILLTYTLDLRKKLELIEIILKSRDINASATVKRIHKFHDLRNVIAHCLFFVKETPCGVTTSTSRAVENSGNPERKRQIM